MPNQYFLVYNNDKQLIAGVKFDDHGLCVSAHPEIAEVFLKQRCSIVQVLVESHKWKFLTPSQSDEFLRIIPDLHPVNRAAPELPRMECNKRDQRTDG